MNREALALGPRLGSFSQPIFDLADDRVFAIEILTRRIQDARLLRPAVPPSASIMHGLSTKESRTLMDLLCLEQTFHALQTLKAPYPDAVFVNTDPVLYEGSTLGDNLPLWLRDLPIPVDSVVFEITEHYLVEPEEMRAVADGLRAAGARIAVDDLGAGSASLRAITALEPDFIKLDRALVDGLHAQPLKRHLVEALVRFAESAGIGFIAEGVENQDDLMALRDLGVRYAQGYHLQRPVKIDVANFRVPQTGLAC